MKPTPDMRAEWVLTLWVHKAALSSIASISDEDIESLKKLISRAIQDAVDEAWDQAWEKYGPIDISMG